MDPALFFACLQINSNGKPIFPLTNYFFLGVQNKKMLNCNQLGACNLSLTGILGILLVCRNLRRVSKANLAYVFLSKSKDSPLA
jgi:hypothetical protein